MKHKFIHIAEDEKFINLAYISFEKVASGLNEFHILMPKGKTSPEFVIPRERIYIHPNTKEKKSKILKSINKNNIVFFHGLSPYFYDLVLDLPPSVKVIWLLFGYEVYNDPSYYPYKKLLAPITRKSYPTQIIRQSLYKRFKDRIRPYARIINRNIDRTPAQIKKAVFKRIDYVGLPYKEELRVICSRIKMKKKFFEFTYFPLEQIVDVNKSLPTSKTNLMIGNSGFKTGNHLDVFDLLKNRDLTSFEKVILPLNYGDGVYVKQIIEKGLEIFSVKLDPLLTFQSVENYNKILETVAVAILYNKRQQGIGNTISLLWFGSKVFLSKYNSFYKFLKKKGITVFNLEDDIEVKNSLTPLDLRVQNTNRLIIKDLFKESKFVALLENQLNNQVLNMK